MAKKSADKKEVLAGAESIDVLEVQQGRVIISVIGTRPIVFNRMAEKAKRELLMPSGRKTQVEKATTLKHNPLEEYRASAHRLMSDRAPTLLAMPAAAFKRAMASAALDLPGTKKAQVGRLSYVDGDYVPIYGIPQIYSTIVRMADMARTPDVRTRAIVPRWAAQFSVTFVKPLLQDRAIVRLLAAAGISVGIGDGRIEKGALTFGLFKLVPPDDTEFRAIVEEGGRQVQHENWVSPSAYDEETSELISWFDEELAKRRAKGTGAAA
jgi:hypothetical protein